MIDFSFNPYYPSHEATYTVIAWLYHLIKEKQTWLHMTTKITTIQETMLRNLTHWIEKIIKNNYASMESWFYESSKSIPIRYYHVYSHIGDMYK